MDRCVGSILHCSIQIFFSFFLHFLVKVTSGPKKINPTLYIDSSIDSRVNSHASPCRFFAANVNTVVSIIKG